MEDKIILRKNPSREACESMIKRILMTEVLQNGANLHFKNATDFLPYFESLYPASDSLTKQVQRAVKSMQLPKDEHGFFLINKTPKQFEQDQEIKQIFAKSVVSIEFVETGSPIFLKATSSLCPYILELLRTSQTLQDKILTMLPTYNGILIYSNEPKQLEKILSSYLVY